MSKPIIFCDHEYRALSERISKSLGATLGEIEQKKFSDGERYLRVLTPVRHQDVVMIYGTYNDDVTLDLFDVACSLVTDGCQSLRILIPFYGYSTMERAVKKGEVVTAKTRARLLSAIPIASHGNEVVLLDLHSEGIPFYFEGQVKTAHLYAKRMVMEEAKRLGGNSFVLGAVDAGRAKWVESLANDMQVPACFIYKRRNDQGEVSVSGTNISVQGQHVIIYDDMIRSGSSILQAAEAYKKGGATRISVITTHGLFSGNALQRFKDSQWISDVISTDSHPGALKVKDPFLKVISVDRLFSDYLKGCYDEQH